MTSQPSADGSCLNAQASPYERNNFIKSTQKKKRETSIFLYHPRMLKVPSKIIALSIHEGTLRHATHWNYPSCSSTFTKSQKKCNINDFAHDRVCKNSTPNNIQNKASLESADLKVIKTLRQKNKKKTKRKHHKCSFRRSLDKWESDNPFSCFAWRISSPFGRRIGGATGTSVIARTSLQVIPCSNMAML